MRWIAGLLILLFVAGFARGQANPSPDQMRQLYDDALNQLKAAQDRKNELSNENQMLKNKLADLQKRLDAAKSAADELAEQTVVLRARDAAWERYIALNPQLAVAWRAYLGRDGLKIGLRPAPPWPWDPQWPFRVE